MRLYHGTSGLAAKAIMRNGFLPLVTNMKHKRRCVFHNSSIYHVYLTDSNAPYYSYAATFRNRQEMAVIEIETDLLDQDRLTYDEIAWERLSRGKDEIAWFTEHGDKMFDYRLRWYKRHMDDDAVKKLYGGWRASLASMGSCAYSRQLPPSAITRVLFFRRDENPALWMYFDAITSLVQYEVAGAGMRASMQHLFGDEIKEKMTDRVRDRINFAVNGILLVRQSEGRYKKYSHHRERLE